MKKLMCFSWRAVAISAWWCFTTSAFATSESCQVWTEWWGKPGQIRPGKIVRLGGYFYAGDFLPNWIASNMDLVDLSAKGKPELTAKLKAVNPNLKVMLQFLGQQIATEQAGAQVVVGLDKSKMSDWLMMRRDMSVFGSHRGEKYFFVDYRNGGQQWVDYFVSQVQQEIKLMNADGLVLDEIPLRRRNEYTDVFGYDEDADFQYEARQFLIALKAKLTVPVLINAGELHAKDDEGRRLWDSFSSALGGGWHEGWIRFYGAPDSPHADDAWLADIESLANFSKINKPYIASAAFRNRGELEYAVANYLIAVEGPSAVFQPFGTYDHKSRGGFNFNAARRSIEMNRDLFDIELGCPLASRKKIKQVWAREFAQGFVLVNPTRSNQKLSLNKVGGNVAKYFGSVVIELHPFSAKILPYN